MCIVFNLYTLKKDSKLKQKKVQPTKTIKLVQLAFILDKNFFCEYNEIFENRIVNNSISNFRLWKYDCINDFWTFASYICMENTKEYEDIYACETLNKVGNLEISI